MRTNRTNNRQLLLSLSMVLTLSLTAACGPLEEGELGQQEDPLTKLNTAPKPVSVNLMATGSGWKQLSVTGTMQDLDTGASTYVTNEQIFVVSGTQGIFGAPLPTSVRNDLNLDMQQLLSSGQISSGSQAVYFVHKTTAEAAAAGTLTALYAKKGVKVLKGCGDYTKTYDKHLPILNKTMSFNDNFNNSGFTGKLQLNGKAHGQVYGKLKLRIKRKWCIPYWARLIDVRVQGNLEAQGTVLAEGNFHKQWNWETQVAKIGLGSLNFTIGIIPVHLAFSLPVDFGIEAEAKLDADLNGTFKANGSFDYLCTTSGCSQVSKSFTYDFNSDSPPTLSITGKTTLKPWLQAAVRATLYDESIAYGQVGVRPYLLAELWGYTGNNCGDADNDGEKEYVNLLTLDMDVGIGVTAKLKVPGLGVNVGKSWSIGKWHVAFWDLSSGNDLAPIFYKKENTSGELEVYDPSFPGGKPFQGRMRPCWPYTDKIDWNIDWKDGTETNVSLYPYILFTAYKSWSGPTPYKVSLTAKKDAHGRQLNKTTHAKAGGIAFPLPELPEQELAP